MSHPSSNIRAGVFALLVLHPFSCSAQEDPPQQPTIFGAGHASCADLLADQPDTGHGVGNAIRRLQTEEWIVGFVSAMNVMSVAHEHRDFLTDVKGEEVVASVVALCRRGESADVLAAATAYVAEMTLPKADAQ